MRRWWARLVASQGGSWHKAILWGAVLVAVVSFFAGQEHALDEMNKPTWVQRVAALHE